MAQLTNIHLDLEPHVTGPNAGTIDSSVTFDVRWSAQDKASKQPYTVFYGLWGDDTWPNGVEDGSDDPVMVPAAPVLQISPNGQNVTSHEIAAAGLDLDRFNEDNAGFDEIRAKVTLVPRTPTSVTAESNHVNLTL